MSPASGGGIGVALGVLLAACASSETAAPMFNAPMGAAVLDPADGGPFTEPVGFVANSGDGTIVPLDLKHGTLLSDQTAAPYISPRGVATGTARLLDQVAAWPPSDTQVDLYATDRAFNTLVEVPYLTGFDAYGNPQVFEPTHTDPVFIDADQSGDSATLEGLLLRVGYTTTEDWTIEYDGAEWWVEGSRSGRQSTPAETGVDYQTDGGQLEFTIEGTATAGDRIELSTETGVVEHDLGGRPMAIARVPGARLLLVPIWDADAEQGSIVAWDPDADEEQGRIVLPEGAQPYRMAFGATGTQVFVADAHLPHVYLIDLDLEDPSASAVDAIPTAAPVIDVAWSGQDDSPIREEYSHLFVAVTDSRRVDVYDLDTDSWIDVNPLDGVDGGLDLHSPVQGLAATPDEVKLQQVTEWGASVRKKVVAVTTADGALRLIEGDTGCLAQSTVGPGAAYDSTGIEQVSFSDRGATSNPTLEVDPATGRQINGSDCGGILRSETWTVTYDGTVGAWTVEGSVSGLQQNLAYENERYLTDDGGMSFLIQSGSLPSTDGDTFTITTDEGVMRISAITRSSSTTESLELPSRPVIFVYSGGPTGGGWDVPSVHTDVLLPVTNSDFVLRIFIDSWTSEVVWQ